MKFFKSLRFRLVILVLMAVVPALAITYNSGREQIRLSRSKTIDDAYRLTRLIAEYESSLVTNTQQLLTHVTRETELNDPIACRAFLENLNQIYHIYSALSVVTQDGQIYCTSVKETNPINLSDRPYLKQAAANGVFTIGDVVTDRLTNKIVLPLVMPMIGANQKINHFLVANLDLSQVIEYSKNLSLPARSAILLVASDGTVLLRYPESENWSGKQLPNAPIIHQIISSSGEGSTEVPGLDNVSRLYAFTPLKSDVNTHLYVSIGIPTEIAYARPNQILTTTLIWMGIAALLALAAAWFGGDLLFLRVVSLTAERDAAERELKEANATLEARVNQRTQQLAEANQQLQFELSERQKMVETLHRRGEELNRLMHLLKQSNDDLQNFAYIASHDLQEPLRKIQAFGDRLLKKHRSQLGEEGSDYTERMVKSANRMQDMINALLSYSRVNTQGKEFSPVDLNQVAGDAIADLEQRIHETNGQVLVSQLPTIDADPVQMHQLLLNLIGNALKFHRPETPPVIHIYAKTVEMDYQPENCQIVLTVEDNGIGFNEKYLDRIFLPFQRLYSREEFDGNGIGLSLCLKIAERHHGQITATSQPGIGSRFMVTLPLKQSKRE